MARVARSEKGSATVELAVLAPVLAGLIGLVVLAGHVSEARQVVDQAAGDAARAASLTRSPTAAAAAASEAAAADLGGHLSCSPSSVAISGAVAPGATLTATVSCTTHLGLWPGALTFSADAGSVVDVYRGTP